MTSREWLVGNAVSPILARNLAQAILRELGKAFSSRPKIYSPTEHAPPVTIGRPRVFKYSANRRFRSFVRIDWKAESRVQLENLIVKSSEKPGRAFPPLPRWVARLYLGYAKEYRCYEISFEQAMALVQVSTTHSGILVSIQNPMEQLLRDATAEFHNLPDASGLQLTWSGRNKDGASPHDVIVAVERLVEAHFGQKSWSRTKIPKESISEVLHSLCVSRGKNADSKPPMDLPVRLLATLVILSLACAVINSEFDLKSGRAVSQTELEAMWSR
jgi:hypothetical protein